MIGASSVFKGLRVARTGRLTSETTRRAKALKSKVECVFAEQKDNMGLFVRTSGVVRATTKIGLANLVYNIKILVVLNRAARATSKPRRQALPQQAITIVEHPPTSAGPHCAVLMLTPTPR